MTIRHLFGKLAPFLVLALALGCNEDPGPTESAVTAGGMGGGMGMGMGAAGEPHPDHEHGSMDGLGNMHGMHGGMHGMHGMMMMAGAAGPWTVQGTIEAFDDQGRYVSIAHEEIPDYMMAMTMPFFPSEEGQLEGLAVGDRVEVVMRRNEEGRHTIDSIQKVEETE